MAKHSIQIDDDKVFEEIVSYCKLNGLKIGSFCTEMLKKQLIIEQYGDTPFATYEVPTVKDDTSPLVIERTIEISAESKEENKTSPVEPSSYNQITMEDINRVAEEIQKHTEKPKKRRL